LAQAEIACLVNAYTAARLADYQLSALLMASFINGLSTAETTTLTEVMLNSGEIIAPTGLDRPLIDKHSPGGVGDTLSLFLAPLLAECAIATGMISGRGLGHTGGTLDKLEAIPGMKVFHSRAKFNSLLRKHHFAITGQTARIAPADKKIYALRDVTGTVESIPLIVASIMSKKLALKSDGIVFDVKTGNGAFMKSTRAATELAKGLLQVAQEARLAARAVVSDMSQPTGRMIGNWLEVEEALEVLKGEGPTDARELTIELAGQMLLVTGEEKSLRAAKSVARRVLADGAAYESFLEYVSACGGKTSVLGKPAECRKSVPKMTVKAPRNGYLVEVDTARLGYLAASVGAGRRQADDRIDPFAGIELMVKLGDRVQKGQPLAAIYARDRGRLAAVKSELAATIRLDSKKPASTRLILKRISNG
jgi:pyrimidine-nucleoside phosphorylase